MTAGDLNSSALLEQQILATLAYSAVFEYPLSFEELTLRLISPFSAKNSSLATFRSIRAVLTKLIAQKKITRLGDYYGISKLFSRKWLIGRANGLKYSQRIFDSEVSWLILKLKHLPGIEALGVSGSLAMNHLKSAHDDVDVVVIVKPNYLWITRCLILIVSILNGKKTMFKSDKWCFNLFLSSHDLRLKPEHRSVFTAYEACQVHWLLDQTGATTQFYQKNKWLELILPKYYQQVLQNSKRFGVKNAPSYPNLAGMTLNWLAFWLQVGYLRLRKSKTLATINLSQAFLHSPGFADKITNKWQKIYEKSLSRS